MKQTSEKKIFASTRPADFIGRASHIDRLFELAHRSSGGLALLAAPTAGLSELLRHTYDRLFNLQRDVIPFYFEVKKSDFTAACSARRFVLEFLTQTVAFRRADSQIIDASPDVNQIKDLAVATDARWIDQLVEILPNDPKSSQPNLRNYLAAPIRAAANGARPFVLLDNLHTLRELEGGEHMLDELCDIFGRSGIPFAFGGHRRALFARTPFETMSVEAFSFADAGAFVEQKAAAYNVEINDQTRDLIAVQLSGNAGRINSLLTSAAEAGSDLNSFQSVEQIYTDGLFGGRLGRSFDAILTAGVPDTYIQERVLWLLLENLTAKGSRVPESYWTRNADRTNLDLNSILDTLHRHEIVNRTGGSVDIDPTNLALCDYLRGRGRIEIKREPRALVVGEALSEHVSRAPQLMARFYRQGAAIGLPSLLLAFDGRRISPALIDYGKFKAEFKGADDEKVLKSVKEDNAVVELPHIVFAANTSAFYPLLNELCDADRSATAIGFAGTDEIAWLAVQIDSKLEATRELAEFWCDRLEMAAENSGFTTYKLWLIAPEGFSPDAVDLLTERGAFGSSRKQIDLLVAFLNPVGSPTEKTTAEEYEIVVPMGGDTELIAAHTIEEIAKRHNFPAKAINQIKTALVEACINATEHSLSPDRRIYQKFAVDDERITITIGNRGLRLADNQPNQNAPDEERRGWGLRLMKSLMDEVRVEKADDGTQITMVKYLEKAMSVEVA